MVEVDKKDQIPAPVIVIMGVVFYLGGCIVIQGVFGEDIIMYILWLIVTIGMGIAMILSNHQDENNRKRDGVELGRL